MYFRAESVELAVQLLDDTQFRSDPPSLLNRLMCFTAYANIQWLTLGDGLPRLGQGGPTMRVAAADFSYKVQKEPPGAGAGATGQKGGSSNMREKKKIIKKTQKLNSKLADWDDDDPQQSVEASSRWDKVVILKHMFTLDELSEDPAAILDIKEDIRGQ